MDTRLPICSLKDAHSWQQKSRAQYYKRKIGTQYHIIADGLHKWMLLDADMAVTIHKRSITACFLFPCCNVLSVYSVVYARRLVAVLRIMDEFAQGSTGCVEWVSCVVAYSLLLFFIYYLFFTFCAHVCLIISAFFLCVCHTFHGHELNCQRLVVQTLESPSAGI
jgi:hypothetical protein